MPEPETSAEAIPEKPSFDPTESILRFPLFRFFGCLGVAIGYFISGCVMVGYGLIKRDWQVARGGLVIIAISIVLALICIGIVAAIESTRQP
jgi:hypothetical protein